MAKKMQKRLEVLVLIGFVSIIPLACSLKYWDVVEIERGWERRAYAIDPATILESLDQGDTDVFTLLEATPEARSSTPAAPVSWRQADYYRIAQALLEQSWGEPVGAQNLYNVSFRIDCSDVERGTFKGATFEFYKITQTGMEETRFEYRVNISPADKVAYTSKVEFRPNGSLVNSFDLANYRITAEEALQIAEKNGGFAKRLEVDNSCKITVNAPGPFGKGWRILYIYKPEPLKSFFDIDIDPQTGKYEMIYPKP